MALPFHLRRDLENNLPSMDSMTSIHYQHIIIKINGQPLLCHNLLTMKLRLNTDMMGVTRAFEYRVGFPQPTICLIGFTCFNKLQAWSTFIFALFFAILSYSICRDNYKTGRHSKEVQYLHFALKHESKKGIFEKRQKSKYLLFSKNNVTYLPRTLLASEPDLRRLNDGTFILIFILYRLLRNFDYLSRILTQFTAITSRSDV